jgi:ABC-type transporter Mla subunit MlaD
LASVSGFLADDRQDLGAALNELATALGQVRDFIGDNRNLITSNVTKLASITQVLVNERNSLAESLDDFPLAATNVLNAYDPVHHTLDGRADLLELTASGAFSGAPAGAGTSSSARSSTRGSAPPLPLPSLDQLGGGQ